MTSSKRNAATAPRGGGLQAVSRTAKVLRALAEHRGGLTLSELSAEVGLPVSSVHRLVAAMDQEGLVLAQPRGRIFLGRVIMEIAQDEPAVLRHDVEDEMRRLAVRVQETVDVAVLDGGSIRFVAQVSAGGVLAVSAVGVRLPLHCTASGKAFLARLSRSEASDRLPKRLPRLTAGTITSRRALWDELEKVRATGIGWDREEYNMGIASVATVVPDAHGPDVSIGVVAPAARFYGRERALAAAVVETARTLEARRSSALRKSRSREGI